LLLSLSLLARKKEFSGESRHEAPKTATDEKMLQVCIPKRRDVLLFFWVFFLSLLVPGGCRSFEVLWAVTLRPLLSRCTYILRKVYIGKCLKKEEKVAFLCTINFVEYIEIRA